MQKQIHRVVAGTEAARQLLARNEGELITADCEMEILAKEQKQDLTKNGQFSVAHRKGVPAPVPQVMHGTKKVVKVDKATYKSIMALRAGKVPHIGKKQQEKDMKRHTKMLAKQQQEQYSHSELDVDPLTDPAYNGSQFSTVS